MIIDLRTTIRSGRPGRVMPAFTQLREKEVSALVQHIRGCLKNSAARQSHNQQGGERSTTSILRGRVQLAEGEGTQSMRRCALFAVLLSS